MADHQLRAAFIRAPRCDAIHALNERAILSRRLLPILLFEAGLLMPALADRAAAATTPAATNFLASLFSYLAALMPYLYLSGEAPASRLDEWHYFPAPRHLCKICAVTDGICTETRL